MVYLVVKDESERGVYSFTSKTVAADLASKNFKNYIFLHEGEEEKALNLVGAKEISDAIFLIRKYRSKQPAETKNSKKTKAEVPANEDENSDFYKILTSLRKQGVEAVSISMANGKDYILSLSNVYYTTEDEVHTNFFTTNGSDIIVNEHTVNAAINAGHIAVLKKSTFEKLGNFIVLNGIDDEYEPNPVDNGKNVTYKHVFKKVMINPLQIVAITPRASFTLGKLVLRTPKLVEYLDRTMISRR